MIRIFCNGLDGRLDAALGDLIVEKAYDNIEFDSREATSVSLVRAECVRLAQALHEAGRGGHNADAWLKAADTDPLPEVRFPCNFMILPSRPCARSAVVRTISQCFVGFARSRSVSQFVVRTSDHGSFNNS
jgi:hypothetical protein